MDQDCGSLAKFIRRSKTTPETASGYGKYPESESRYTTYKLSLTVTYG